MRTYVVNKLSTFALRQAEGEVEIIKFDWNNRVGEDGTSVSSVAWSIETGDAAISGTSLTSNVATGTLTTAQTGTSVVKVIATMADGQKSVVYLVVKVDSNDRVN